MLRREAIGSRGTIANRGLDVLSFPTSVTSQGEEEEYADPDGGDHHGRLDNATDETARRSIANRFRVSRVLEKCQIRNSKRVDGRLGTEAVIENHACIIKKSIVDAQPHFAAESIPAKSVVRDGGVLNRISQRRQGGISAKRHSLSALDPLIGERRAQIGHAVGGGEAKRIQIPRCLEQARHAEPSKGVEIRFLTQRGRCREGYDQEGNQ